MKVIFKRYIIKLTKTRRFYQWKQIVWYGQKDVRVEDRKSKELQDNEVKVKVSWAGICGTDLHEYLEGPIFISTDKPDPFLGQKAPVTLGHEFARSRWYWF